MSASLLEVARELATDAAAKAAYAADPDGFLVERGLADLAPDDLATALEHVADALPATTAAQLPPPGPEVDPATVLDGLAAAPPDGTDLEFGAGLLDDGDGPDPAAGDADRGDDPDPDLGPDLDDGDEADAPDAGDVVDDPVAAVFDDDADVDEDGDDLGDGTDLDFGGGAPEDDLDLDG